MKDHKIMYGVYLRVGFVSSVIIFIMLFTLVPYRAPQPYEPKRDIVTMIEEISVQLDPVEEPPREERPKVAIEAPDEYIQEAVKTMGKSDYIEDPLRVDPVGPDIEVVPYYKIEVKPKPVYSKVPEYPALCRQAGIEGTTVVKMLIDTDGQVIDVKILKSSGNQMLDQAAVAAAQASTFTPAKQRDRLVRVWVARTMNFQLK